MNLITAKVYLNEGTDFFNNFNVDTAQLRLAATFDIDPSGDPKTDLHDIYEQLNVGGDMVPAEEYTDRYRAAGNRSLSVGDVVILGEIGWTVAQYGWDTISTADLVKAIRA